MPLPGTSTRRVSASMLGAIFLIFASVGFLIALMRTDAWGWVAGLWTAAFSGCIAMGWTVALRTKRYWLLLPVNAAPFFAQPVFAPLHALGLFDVGAGVDDFTRRIILAVLSVVSTSLGFTLLVRHVSETERRSARLDVEMRLARGIHQRLVPPIDIETPRCRAFGVSVASAEVGGDLLDHIRTDDALEFHVGDVSGHGVAAGVVMAMLKSALRVRTDDRSPHATLARLSETIGVVNAPGVFATFVALRIPDDPSRPVGVALAGHHPVLWWRHAESRLHRIDNEHLPLGVAGDTYASRTVDAEPGDRLIVFTDGLVEVMNAAGEQFGSARLIEKVERACAEGTDDDALIERVRSVAEAWGPRGDDQTIG
ncbi:MAG: PP2C family protein-serine/threonine phosphatase, partial [Planctomycetota bacterium]